ncbi:MAG: hypothetical protein AAF386_03700 [Pseudomonadota bacterium]
MSISKAYAIGALMVLGGCDAALLPSADGESVDRAVLQGGLTIKGPDGYCIDPETVQRSFRTTAVTLFSCARLKNPDGADPTQGHVFTASATRGQLDDPAAFAAFLTTDQGRAILSSTEDAATVTVHRTRATAVGVYVDYTDTSTPQHLGQRQWRGFVKVDNQIAVLGLYQGANDPVAGSTGESALRSFAAEVISANLDQT